MLSGSDQSRSHMGPSWGISCTLSNCLILSRVSRDGDSPPCRENICDFIKRIRDFLLGCKTLSYLILNKSSERKIIKYFCEIFPDISISVFTH